MQSNVGEVIKAALHLTVAEQRELLARLWPMAVEQSGDQFWTSVRLGACAQVTAGTPEQEPYLDALASILRSGALARLEDEADGTYEIYGPDRTYYVTLSPAKERVLLLSSWAPEQPPREVILDDEEAEGEPRN